MSVFNKIISFFCGDNIDKIRIRESTVMRNNQVHKLHKEIIDQLGDLARSYPEATCMVRLRTLLG